MKTSKDRRRLDRQFERLERHIPTLPARMLRWLRKPAALLVRIPLGFLLVIGGILSFLPILGVWMLPLGLLLLAVDMPFLQHPISMALIVGERQWKKWRRRRRQRTA